MRNFKSTKFIFAALTVIFIAGCGSSGSGLSDDEQKRQDAAVSTLNNWIKTCGTAPESQACTTIIQSYPLNDIFGIYGSLYIDFDGDYFDDGIGRLVCWNGECGADLVAINKTQYPIDGSVEVQVRATNGAQSSSFAANDDWYFYDPPINPSVKAFQRVQITVGNRENSLDSMTFSDVFNEIPAAELPLCKIDPLKAGSDYSGGYTIYENCLRLKSMTYSMENFDLYDPWKGFAQKK